MKKHYPLDNSAIVHLAVKNRRTTNTFRLCFYLDAPIDPAALQQAADAVCPRFPTMAAGIRRGFANYRVTPVSRIQVRQDTGLLQEMTWEEIARCATRILYHGSCLSLEMFHSLADGHGAWHFFRTLTAQYLHITRGLDLSACENLLTPESPVRDAETEDSFLTYADGQKGKMARTPSYLIRPTGKYTRGIYPTVLDLPAAELLETARGYGVTLTTLLTAVMAVSIQELQTRQGSAGADVRVMVPINLRKLFPSESLRNFSLYALPNLKYGQEKLPLAEILPILQDQLEQQLSRDALQRMISTNVATERHPLLRRLPLGIKNLGIRIGYRFVGARNSSITFTNLGVLFVPEAMKPYITGADVFLTPRIYGPYNCGAISYNGRLHIILTRSCAEPGLEPIFTEKLKQLGHTPNVRK